MKSSVRGSSRNVRSPCQQMASRLLLFTKFGPYINHGESISEDKFLLEALIKCNLCGVHSLHPSFLSHPFLPFLLPLA